MGEECKGGKPGKESKRATHPKAWGSFTYSCHPALRARAGEPRRPLRVGDYVQLWMRWARAGGPEGVYWVPGLPWVGITVSQSIYWVGMLSTRQKHSHSLGLSDRQWMWTPLIFGSAKDPVLSGVVVNTAMGGPPATNCKEAFPLTQCVVTLMLRRTKGSPVLYTVSMSDCPRFLTIPGPAMVFPDVSICESRTVAPV